MSLKALNPQVKALGENVSTDDTLTLYSEIPGYLPIKFSPMKVGVVEGSVVFDSPSTGEFWHRIVATAHTPPPTQLGTMECKLGTFVAVVYLQTGSSSAMPVMR